LQKKEGANLGRGAEFSSEKARLYVSLDEIRGINKHRLTIIKGKNWAQPGINPNNKSIVFNIKDGCIQDIGEHHGAKPDGTRDNRETLFDEEPSW
jgi:hypothetical protein